MTSKEKAEKLYEIVDVLKEFKEYTKGRTDQATRNTPKARQLVRKAMTLLADNLKLLNECKNKYGCHSPLQECFECIEQAASFLRTKDLGDYSYWVCNFCKPRLWDGVKRSFADECMRYANEVDREISEQKVIISLGEYESEHGNKIGISPADLEREVEMTWPQLRPVLDRLGRKGLIKGHKGDGYTSYWLSVEFDENDPYKHQCSVKEFRLTQQGQKLYGKIAEKPAKTEQENKDTKSEREGMIEPKPPVFLQNAIWILKHGKKYWWLLILAALVLLFWYILPTLNLFGKKNPDTSLEAKTSGDSSPAVITSGPNSPVTVNYDLGGNMEEASDIKAELTNIKNKITKLAEQLQPQLAKQYSRAYTAFGVYQDGFVHPNGLMPENLEIDWDTGRVQSINDNILMVKLPNMTLNGESFVNENSTFLKKRIGAKSGSIIQLGWFNPILEVIGIDGDLVVVALGFPADDSKK